MTRLKKKVLIAENKQFLVDVIRETLSSEGYDCVCVNTENELYGVIDNVDAAVVGLDICPGDQPRRVDMIAEIKYYYREFYEFETQVRVAFAGTYKPAVFISPDRIAEERSR